MPDNGIIKTPAQAIAVVLAIVGILADNLIIDGHTSKIITGIASIVIPVAWFFADAWIHHSHNKAVSVVEAAQIAANANMGINIKP